MNSRHWELIRLWNRFTVCLGSSQTRLLRKLKRNLYWTFVHLEYQCASVFKMTYLNRTLDISPEWLRLQFADLNIGGSNGGGRDVRPQVQILSLPPASKGWGKVIFSVCVSSHLDGEGGNPSTDGGIPFPGQSGRYPFPSWGGGTPFPGPGGVPILRPVNG